MRINYVDSCAGSGKTTAAIKSIAHGVERLQSRFVIAQPTRQLIASTLERARQMAPSVRWRAITADQYPGEVASEFRKALQARDVDCILVTHKCILDNPDLRGKVDWSLIVDEVPQVDFSFQKNLSITWDWWTEHFDVVANSSCDALLDVMIKPGHASIVDQWARNEEQDDVVAVVQPFFNALVNPHWNLALTRGDWMSAGWQGRAQLHAHGWLQPSVLEGWGDLTIMGANLTNSLLYLVWKSQGVDFQPHPMIKPAFPRHDDTTGSRVRVKYFTEGIWSKTLRNKCGGLQSICNRLKDHVDGRHIWSANGDVQDWQWTIPLGCRIPPVSHGLNDYRDFDKAVFVAALNDMTSHFAWAEKTFGIDPMELSRAKAQEAAYQMIMRTALRDRDSDVPVSVIVPDRRTADYICGLLPGSRLDFLDLGIPELGPSQRGRPTKVVVRSNAERNAAHQKRKKQLKATVTALRDLQERVTHDGLVSNENTLYMDYSLEDDLMNQTCHSVTLSFELTTTSRSIVNHTFNSWDVVRDELRRCHEVVFASKANNWLISGATFDPDASPDTTKGAANVVQMQLLQLDFDDSPLDPERVHRIFQDVRHLLFNSYSNGRDGLWRYRMVVPLNCPVGSEAYKAIWDICADRVRNIGYSVGTKLGESGINSGLDISKRTPSSWFYLPCQAKDQSKSFWIDHWDGVPMLDPLEWLDRVVIDAPEYQEVAAVKNHSPDLRRLLERLVHRETVEDADHQREECRKRAYEAALEDWRATTAGEGNAGFWRFACRLAQAGYDHAEIAQLLNMHHGDSQSNRQDRKKQIKSITISLGNGRT
ncbi:DEAD/DEAH box helicase [Azospirillum sp. TSA2s]|uniref:DEAD/DEAH box helicase family protein n=1 Tax=Azospirillum sp. TSA2s TaxID=709810 RepID=UPI0010AAEB8B|nr:DEAD/DEAH box helicase family protein [Azospirillum sp. TSA2s]QCG92704.1 DEAD/DEAH box helicase [Azospirillum sp. TSA2s]